MAVDKTEPVEVPKQGFVLGSKLYDKLKFLVQVILPGVATLYAALAAFWGFPHVNEVVGSITAIALFLGLMLGQSTKNFVPPTTDAHPVGDAILADSTEVEGKQTLRFELNVPPEEFVSNDVVKFNVRRE